MTRGQKSEIGSCEDRKLGSKAHRAEVGGQRSVKSEW